MSDIVLNKLLPAGLDQSSKLQSQGCLYALIDPFFGEPAGYELNVDALDIEGLDHLKSLREKSWQGRHVFLAQTPVSTVSVAQLPYIVALQNSQDEHLSNMLEGAIDNRQTKNNSLNDSPVALHSFAALIETSLPGEMLMQRLQAMWTYTGSGSQARYFRLGDMRVMQWWAYILGTPALAQWFGPIDTWHVLNAQSQWISYEGLHILRNASEKEQFSARQTLEQVSMAHTEAKLDAQQKLMLSLSEAVNRVVDQWQQNGKNASQPLANSYERIWRSVRSAYYAQPKAQAEELVQTALAVLLQHKLTDKNS